jgi:hypothetical protein
LQGLTAALRAYAVARGDYPEDLDALAESRDGLPARVEKSSLVDPWGRPYRYEPQTPHPTDGTPLVYSDGSAPGDAGQGIRNWAVPGGETAGPNPELAFARPVAEEFLGHVTRGNLHAALAMGTPGFRQRWEAEVGQGAGDSRGSAPGVLAPLKHASWQLDASTLSAGQDGAAFTGRFVPTQGAQAPFTLRLVKDRTSGQWNVDGLDVRGTATGQKKRNQLRSEWYQNPGGCHAQECGRETSGLHGGD